MVFYFYQHIALIEGEGCHFRIAIYTGSPVPPSLPSLLPSPPSSPPHYLLSIIFPNIGDGIQAKFWPKLKNISASLKIFKEQAGMLLLYTFQAHKHLIFMIRQRKLRVYFTCYKNNINRIFVSTQYYNNRYNIDSILYISILWTILYIL